MQVIIFSGEGTGACSDDLTHLHDWKILTLQIKRLLNELHGQKTANGKLIQPNQIQL